MTQIEYLKNHRRCECNNFTLVYWRKEFPRYKTSRSSNNITRILTMLSNIELKQKTIRWIAECKECGKFYFATTTKKDMISNLKELGCSYEVKHGEQNEQGD